MGLRMLRTTLRTVPSSVLTRAERRALKEVDPHYRTQAHRDWAEAVIVRAGGRCQAVDDGGNRCCKSTHRGSRMFADHVVERRDGGDPFDPANGQCLCGSHHTLKTLRERARRAGS